MGKKKVHLLRTLNLLEVTLAGIGVILGAGIYTLLGIAVGTAGNAVWISFVLAALVAICTGLSYAELSARFKSDAGEFQYVKAAGNKLLATGVGISIIAAGFVSAATVAIGFGRYLSQLVPISEIVAAGSLVLLMTAINAKGIRETSKFNSIATCIECAGLLLILFWGWRYLGTVAYT